METFKVTFDRKVSQIREDMVEPSSPEEWAINLKWIRECCERSEENDAVEKLKRYIELIQLFLQNKESPEPEQIAEFRVIRAPVIEMLAEKSALKASLDNPPETIRKRVAEFKASDLYKKSFEVVSTVRIGHFMALDKYALEVVCPEDEE